MNRFSVTRNSVSHNMKIKNYPDGEFKVTVASKPIFIEKGFEPAKENDVKVPKPKNQDNPAREDSIRRAKERVSDIIRMNDFSCFVTLTLNSENIDRSSVSDIREKLNNFLSNHVQRSSLKYILIPEYHKKNKAVHFHGFFCGDLVLSDSGTVKASGFKKPLRKVTAKRYGLDLEECQTVYNLPQWKLGYSTAITTDGNNTALSKYITKYITKDVQKIFGNFYFAGGKGLVRNVPVTLSDTDYNSFKADNEVYCPVIDTSFKYFDTARKTKGVSDEV